MQVKGCSIAKKSFAILAAFIFIFISCAINVSAAAIQTDREGSLEITTDGTFIYMDYEGPWSNYLGTQIGVTVNGASVNGAMSGIVINAGNGGEGGSFQVYNAWGQPIGGALGRIENINPGPEYGYETMRWSVMIPLSAYGGEGVSSLSFDWKGQKAELLLKSGEDGNTDTDSGKDNTDDQNTEAGEPIEGIPGGPEGGGADQEDGSLQENGQESRPLVITSGLTVDGYYEDWSGYPKTEITYLGNNTKSVHIGQMAVDGDRLYVHFAMNDLYTSQMRIQIWNLQINGNTYPLQILPVTENGSIDWQNSETKWPEGTHHNFDVFVGYYPSCEGKVAFTIYDEAHTPEGKGDEIEFSLSLDKLSEITGVPVDQMSTIRLNNPNIGAEGVEISGTPTGPWLGALAALVIATAYMAKRRKREQGLL